MVANLAEMGNDNEEMIDYRAEMGDDQFFGVKKSRAYQISK
jgi:hypothetical protein